MKFLIIMLVLMDLEFSICFFTYEMWKSHHYGYCTNIQTYVDPFIAILPAFWRFLQCLRRYYDTKDKTNLINAGKYSFTFIVIIFSSLRIKYRNQAISNTGYESGYGSIWFWLWLLSIVITTIYSLSWDLKMDWNLLHVNKSKPRNTKKTLESNFMLRKHLIYNYKSVISIYFNFYE